MISRWEYNHIRIVFTANEVSAEKCLHRKSWFDTHKNQHVTSFIFIKNLKNIYFTEVQCQFVLSVDCILRNNNYWNIWFRSTILKTKSLYDSMCQVWQYVSPYFTIIFQWDLWQSVLNEKLSCTLIFSTVFCRLS